MSGTIYNKAFAVELSHNFYLNVDLPENKYKVNADFDWDPTSDCIDLLERGRMRFVRNGKGFMVLYKAYLDGNNVQQTFVPLTGDAEFVFAMRMRVESMPLISNVSNLNVGTKTYTAGKFFMLDQTIDVGTPVSPTTVSFQASLANMLRPSTFIYNFQPSPASTSNADVIVKLGTTTVFTALNVPYNATTNSYSVEIDLSNQAKDFYTLTAYETGIPANVINTTDFYVDSDLANQSVFGVIRIKYKAAAINRLYDSLAGVNKYISMQYAFVARQTYWRYYVIPQNIDTSIYDLAVLDSSNTYTFYATNPGGQPYGQPDTTIKINGLNPVVMESQSKIPFSEKVLTGLTVSKKVGAAESTAVPNLSNALFSGVDSDRLGAVKPVPTITPDISEIFVIV